MVGSNPIVWYVMLVLRDLLRLLDSLIDNWCYFVRSLMCMLLLFYVMPGFVVGNILYGSRLVIKYIFIALNKFLDSLINNWYISLDH